MTEIRPAPANRVRVSPPEPVRNLREILTVIVALSAIVGGLAAFAAFGVEELHRAGIL